MSHWLISPETPLLKTSFHKKVSLRNALMAFLTCDTEGVASEVLSYLQIQKSDTKPDFRIWQPLVDELRKELELNG